MDTELTDDQWEVIRPLIPAQGRIGRPRADDRQVLTRHLACTQERLPLEGFAPAVQPSLHLLAEVEKMGRAGGMGQHLPGFAHDSR